MVGRRLVVQRPIVRTLAESDRSCAVVLTECRRAVWLCES